MSRMLVAIMVAAGLAAIGCAGAAGAPAVAETRSRTVTSVAPAIPRPDTKPCVVQLFPRTRFGRTGNDTRMDAAPRRFHYTPPARCKGPWAKVVLEADFSVAAGYQYDRTASIWLQGVNLYFGTTQEPTPSAAQSWQVQRDLTDYSSLLRTPGAGQVRINNWLDAVRASAIHASARLLFYPADKAFPSPRIPDKVYPLNGDDTIPAKLKGAGAQLARNIVFPRNTTRVYIDLIAQPQAHDEFYYMCLPDNLIRQVGRPRSNGSIDRQRVCDGGSFREVEVSIDGKPAGLAPVSPWIFTGGLDPLLWQPAPAAQTLNLMPYRVDLTPFAGLLSDGKPHHVAVQMLGTPDFFSVAATLLVYQDQRVRHTGGAVTRDTLQTATMKPTVTSTLKAGPSGVNGDVFTHARQHYSIEGYVDTQAGRVHSRVETTIGFDNLQQFTANGGHGRHHSTRQTARVDSTSSGTGQTRQTRSLHKRVDYTLGVNTFISTGRDKTRHRAVQVRQRFHQHIRQREPGLPFYQANVNNTHLAAGRLSYTRGNRKSFTGHDQSGTASFRFSDSLGDCYHAEVRVHGETVTGRTHGFGCLDPGAMHWFVHPDGSPDSFGWRGVVVPRRPVRTHAPGLSNPPPE